MTAVEADPRWPALVAALADLRAAGRCSVRIVDAGCGDGALLIRAAVHAHMLGFVAIEGRGIAADAASARIAALHAAALHDPAIGLVFEARGTIGALAQEAEFPADILLWHGEAGAAGLLPRAARAAAGTVIGDGRAVAA